MEMKMQAQLKLQEIFPGIYSYGNRILTRNLAPGKKVYGEGLFSISGTEYRNWDPFRSKLCGAMKKGLKKIPINSGANILYLGSAEGTTISHISDIIGENGIAFGVDVSARVMKKFLYLCETRKNLVPILADANSPEGYAEYLEGTKIDLLYQDISQKNQTEIFIKNAVAYLPRNNYALIAIKARSISSEGDTKIIFENARRELEREFEIEQSLNLAPFDREHEMVLCRRK